MSNEKTVDGLASDLNAKLCVPKKRGKIAMKSSIPKFIYDDNHGKKIKFINQQKVTDMTSVPKSTLYYLMDKGLFPKNVRIASGGKVAWVEHEVQKWIDDRVKERFDA